MSNVDGLSGLALHLRQIHADTAQPLTGERKEWKEITNQPGPLSHKTNKHKTKQARRLKECDQKLFISNKTHGDEPGTARLMPFGRSELWVCVAQQRLRHHQRVEISQA